MTALAQDVAIGDNQLLIDAPFAAGSFPGLVKIGTEILVVGGEEHRTGTTLALSQPATAVHSSGATVTYAGRPYDADFLAATAGVGGGAIAVTGGGTTVNDVTELDLGAVPVSDAGGGVAAVEQSLLSTTVTLTNDQIKDLPFTPVVIVPSPGADVLIAPVSIWVVLDTPVAYTDVDAAFALTFLGGGLAGGGLDMAQYAEADDGFLSGGSGAFRPVIHIPIYMPVVGGIVTAFWVGRVGNRIEFQSSGQAVALTGGDAANTITVTVIYTTVTL